MMLHKFILSLSLLTYRLCIKDTEHLLLLNRLVCLVGSIGGGSSFRRRLAMLLLLFVDGLSHRKSNYQIDDRVIRELYILFHSQVILFALSDSIN